jgi:hypothetical protein
MPARPAILLGLTLGGLVWCASATTAAADDASPTWMPSGPIAYVHDTSEVAADDPISNIIFLNRCVGGCALTATDNVSDARTNMTSIPKGDPGPRTMQAFAQGDEMWDALVACVKDVYAPYNVEVTDVDPGESVVHHEAIVAGFASDIGWQGALGVGSVRGDCQAINNGISFTFANQIPDVEFMCATVAQESAHTFGLEHVLECTDPLTYLGGCGRKYFRNVASVCGEELAAPRSCACSGRQNSHVRFLDLFGYSDTPMEAPTTTLSSPADGETVNDGFAILASAAAQRGVSIAEFWLNGYLWGTVDDFDFANQGGTYQLTVPGDVPDGRIDIEVRVYNDLQTEYGTATATVQKGELCDDAATDCLEGQACDGEGRCAWPAPTGALGDACEYPQFCLSGVCEVGGDGAAICTQACQTGTADSCPAELTCVPDEGSSLGFCFVAEPTGGCCSATASSTSVRAHVGLAALVFGLLFVPRRRRRAPSTPTSENP